MVATILGASAPADDFSRRQFLPASAAVKGPRFRHRDWALSATAREILDEIHVPLTPRPERDHEAAESIVMCGASIQNSVRVGAHVVRQHRTVATFEAPELSIAEPVVRDESLAAAAGEALAAMNSRRPTARRTPRAPAPKPPKATSPAAIAVMLVLAALTVCALVSVVRSSL